MYARAQLAIMDHNSGMGRVQSKRKDGKLMYRTVFSKVASNWVSKKIMERKKKNLIDENFTYTAYAEKHGRQKDLT